MTQAGLTVQTLSPVEQYMLTHVRPEADLDIGPAPDELLSWLKASAIPLGTAKPGAGNEDLRPLRASLAHAQVVGMGEATHGTAEFFTLKHRLFRFLVEELGFTALGLEAGFAESLALAAYVRGGPAPSFAGQHPELVELIEWMRRRNASGRHPQLQLFGFDMQSPTLAISQALTVARRVDPTVDRLAHDLAPLGSDFGATQYRAAPPSARRRVQHGLARVGELLARAVAGHEDDEELATAALLVRSAQWAERYAFYPTQRERDAAMAAMVLDVLDRQGPNGRLALWAHNAHVQRGVLIELVGGQQVPTMGQLLHQELQGRYVPVSFAFDRGSFRAVNLMGGEPREFTVAPAPSDTFDGALASTGQPLAAFTLQQAPSEGPAHRWLARRPAARCVGGASTDNLAPLSFVRTDPRASSDVVLFVAETTAARDVVPEEQVQEAKAAPAASSEASLPNLTFHDLDSNGCPRGWQLQVSAAEGSVQVSGACLLLSRQGSSDGAASLVHRIAVEGESARTVHVRAELAATAAAWQGGGHLSLRYDSQATVDEQLAHPPFRLTPTHPFRDDQWHEVSLALEVPAAVRVVEIALTLVGSGEARLRALSVQTTVGADCRGVRAPQPPSP